MKKPRITRWGFFPLPLNHHLQLNSIHPSPARRLHCPPKQEPSRRAPPPTPPCRRTNTVHLFITRVPRSPSLSQSDIVIAFLYNTQHPQATPFSFTWGKENLCSLPTGRGQLPSRRKEFPKRRPGMLSIDAYDYNQRKRTRERGAH